MKKKHGFTHTHIDLHGDGSATIHHVHADGPHKDIKHAVADTDSLHDSLEDHLNPEEIEDKVEGEGKDPEALEEQIHPGIHQKVLELSGEGK